MKAFGGSTTFLRWGIPGSGVHGWRVPEGCGAGGHSPLFPPHLGPPGTHQPWEDFPFDRFSRDNRTWQDSSGKAGFRQ